MSEVRHGCFNSSGAVQSGSGYSVSVSAGTYTLDFNPAPGTGNYTVLLDGRTSTGRALALSTSGTVSTGLTLTSGWLDAGGETITRICFMLVR